VIRRLFRPAQALLTAAFVLAAQGVVQLCTAAQAAAVTGLFRTSNSSAYNSTTVKTVDATCPAGTRLIGGGGQAEDGNDRRIRLTQLIPTAGAQDHYRVTAVEPPGGYAENWAVTAFAICAAPLPGLQIVAGAWVVNLFNVGAATAACGNNKKVLGVGGDAGTLPDVAMHLVRPDGNLNLARLTARMDTNFTAGWIMRAYAICVNPVPGQVSEGQIRNASAAGVGCPDGTKVHGAGGGGGTGDAGAVYLQSVVPSSNLRTVTSTMTGVPTGEMIAQATCAT